MAIEQGVVIKLGERPNTAWVMTTRSGACESCASRENCHAGATGEHQEVEAMNVVGARAGDRIQLMIRTGSLIKATFLLYVFPVLCMLGGAVAGHLLAAALGVVNNSALAAVVAMMALGAGLWVVRTRGRQLGQDVAYRPHIVRILGRAPLDASENLAPQQCPGGNANH